MLRGLVLLGTACALTALMLIFMHFVNSDEEADGRNVDRISEEVNGSAVVSKSKIVTSVSRRRASGREYDKARIIGSPWSARKAERANVPDVRLIQMFVGGDLNDTIRPDYNPVARRAREVELNPELLSDAPDIRPGYKIDLCLFNDAAYSAKVRSVGKNADGALVISGELDGDEGGRFYFSNIDGRACGFIESPEDGKLYSIGTKDGKTFYAFEDDPARISRLSDGDSLRPKSLGSILPSLPPQANSASTVIDTMIFYTPAAEQWAKNDFYGPIQNIAAIATARTNTAFEQSGAGIEMRLALTQKTDYGESPKGTVADLSALTFKNGVAGDIHARRDKYGADIVTIFTKCDDLGGLAWMPPNTKEASAYGFNIVRVQQAATGYTHAHECGHNLGAHHSKYQSVAPGPGIYENSSGWQWSGKNGTGYCTIMTYEDIDNNPVTGVNGGKDFFKIGIFSNPVKEYKGALTGNVKDANNVLTLQQNKSSVSAFRSIKK